MRVPAIRRAAIVYKPYEGPHRAKSPGFRAARAMHRATIRAVLRSVRESGVAYDLVRRSQRIRQSRYGLVIAVGGDGTMLSTAHQLDVVPVLPVNSSPQQSEGFLTSTDKDGFDALFRAFLLGRAPMTLLQRLRVLLNGRALPQRVLNDILIAESNPAMISRYELSVGSRTERQRSSGVWISTAAGSTAAIRSAGGRILPLRSKAFQFCAREVYTGRGGKHEVRMASGRIRPPSTLRVRSMMHRGVVFIDGARVRYPFHFGDRLVIRTASAPLQVVGLRRPASGAP